MKAVLFSKQLARVGYLLGAVRKVAEPTVLVRDTRTKAQLPVKAVTCEGGQILIEFQGTHDMPSKIFVFGSNESGIHGAGAALFAVRNRGAELKVGFGPHGQSFAIPTKDWRIQTLPIEVIEHYVQRFIVYARMHPDQTFQVTCIGCGLAGLRHDVIAPLFKYAPPNCQFDELWKEWLPKKKFWGTF